MSAVEITGTSSSSSSSSSSNIEKKQNQPEDFLSKCDQDKAGEVIKFQLLSCKDTEISDFDVILISITDDEKVASGENPVFDFFIQSNEENTLRFAFLKWSDSEEWTIAPHKVNTLFFKTGFLRHKEAIIEYLNRNAWVSTDESKHCVFSIREYNEDPNITQKLTEGEDYESFCPLKMISSEPSVIDGKKYFRFPGSFYKQYKKMSEFRNKTLDVKLFGVNDQTYGSLFEEGDQIHEHKINYFEVEDPFTHRFLSLMRKYDFAAFEYDIKKNCYVMDPSHTHPMLFRLYGHDQDFIDCFFGSFFFDDDSHPFVEIIQQKDSSLVTRVSILYMEHVVSKIRQRVELSENVKKVINMIVSFGKRERFVLQKMNLLEEEPHDSQKPFYLAVENSIFQQKGFLIKKYFN